jgi:hypothetical protein
VIYVDTSIAIAHLLAEDRVPAESLWRETLVSSRLLEYELWVRIHARGLAGSHGEAAGQLIARIALLELDRRVLARAREPFPLPLRTLDALHLGSLLYLISAGQQVSLASYDDRMRKAARELEIPVADF